MGHNSLLGIEPAASEPAGRKTADLGPSDSSDSGSDVAGIEDFLDPDDPGQPVDVALRRDRPRSFTSPDALASAADAAGTGERRSATGDAGRREAPDISVDRVVEPHREADAEGFEATDEDEDPDLAFVDEAEAGDVFEDESADPVGDGHSDADFAQAQAPVPGQPNPQPDPPHPRKPGDEEEDDDAPDDEGDAELRKPGRD